MAKKGDKSNLPERPDQPSVGARCSAQIGPVPFFRETRVDLERVFSEFHHFRFTVGTAIGSVDDLSVREQLEKMARSLDDDFAELQADVPTAWTRQTLWPHSPQSAPAATTSGYRSHLVLQKTPPEQFGEQHELDYQRGIPPIREVREDWNADR